MIRSLILFLTLTTSLISRETIPLLQGWSFLHTDEFAATPPDFGTASSVDLPHDWSWEAGPRKDGAQADKGGYRIGGVGWYRRSFRLPDSFAGKRVVAHFDGAYRHATVFLNGHELGSRPYGFISFVYELNPHLKAGENMLDVRLDCRLEPSTRWYHPCGLYAPVRLEATDADSRLDREQLFITTPEVAAASAKIHLSAGIIGPAKHQLRTELFGPDGALLATSKAAAAETLSADFTLKNPSLWSPEDPVLHTARLTLLDGMRVVDSLTVPFGIRSIRWDKNTGFHLNGKNIKLRGVCEHLTGGPVGGAWPEPLIEWKLRQLKAMGCNAIRTSHNPQVPAFYETCNRLGILVMNEIFDGWKRKAPQDYGALHFSEWWRRDLTDWIRRDRNHPCVIIWSVGNETSGAVASAIVDLCHELDPTRLVTSGASASKAMDVIGINGHSETPRFFKTGPLDKAFVATEAPHTWQVRGFYQSRTWYRDGFKPGGGKVFETPDLTEVEIFTHALFAPTAMTSRKQVFNSSFDNATVRINARQHWEKTRDLPWISGFFRWTGFDYPGEAGYVHGGWPFHAFAGGVFDLAGFEKDLFYFYQSQWTREAMVHILPHWTHPRMQPGTKIPVHVYSNSEEVELLLNGRSLGTKRPGRTWNEMQCGWLVPWEPGTLTAVARRSGQEVARHQHQSAGAPAKLQINADTRFPDHPILTVTIADSQNHTYPYGENQIRAALTGPARILSFENGHPADTDPPVAAKRRAFMGQARLFLAGSPECITFGAILGERRQLSSNIVNIDARRVKPDGTEIPTSFTIHYTLDGSDPGRSSPRYQGPFEIPTACTVRAILLADGKPVLNLAESFGPGLGLHWTTSGESPPPSGPPAGLQAEAASFTGAKTATTGKGYHGTGYLDFKRAEGTVEFYQENDGSAGPATLAIRYAHADPRSQRPMDLLINGKHAARLEFPPTGSWTETWKTVEVPMRIRPGANTILLKTTGKSGPNLDEIDIRQSD
jgi:beta-galactosidase